MFQREKECDLSDKRSVLYSFPKNLYIRKSSISIESWYIVYINKFYAVRSLYGVVYHCWGLREKEA